MTAAMHYVVIVCTGGKKSTHGKLRLTTARTDLEPDGQRGMSHLDRCFGPPDPDAEPGGISRESYEFWCTTCGRNPKINRDKWWNAVDDFARLGFPELDISQLSS